MSQKSTAAISTMPKSSTWYCLYFFHILSHFRQRLTQIPARPIEGVLALPQLGLSRFFICHAECPTFMSYDSVIQQRCSQLRYHTDGYNWAAPVFQMHPALNPTQNPAARLVYLVRNPLDQTVSFSDHSLKHKDQTVMARKLPDNTLQVDDNGAVCLPKTPREFFFSHNWESYLKQYLSWKHSAANYPNQIMIIPYAQLVREPEATFGKMLDFIGVDQNSPAFQLSSKDNLQELESQFGHALGRDQTDPNSRHIRDGRIAKWREHFDDDDLKRLAGLFDDWGVSLDEFVFD